MLYWSEYSRFVMTLFAILAPFSAVPIFVSLTKGQTRAQKSKTALTASFTVFCILTISAFSGTAILKFFGTDLPAFQVAGGMVLLFISLSLINAKISRTKQAPEETIEAEDKEEVGVVPLALPLMAGPGSMSAVIIQAEKHKDSNEHIWIIIGSIALVCLIVWSCLKLATPIGDKLGITGINILNRIFGLLLASISIQIMANGLIDLFPGLK